MACLGGPQGRRDKTRFMLLYFRIQKAHPGDNGGPGQMVCIRSRTRPWNTGVSAVREKSRIAEPRIFPWGWASSRATRHQCRALMTQKRSLRTIHSLRASGSTKSWQSRSFHCGSLCLWHLGHQVNSSLLRQELTLKMFHNCNSPRAFTGVPRIRQYWWEVPHSRAKAATNHS
jgi:hypothetical protein